jgi:hypothetical protein
MNVVKCPKCGRNLIAEEIANHKCPPTQIESVITLHYSSFIPLKVNGKGVPYSSQKTGNGYTTSNLC